VKKRHPITSLLFICVLALSSFINSEDPILKIFNALSKNVQERPVEKVHLSFDKPYYAIGDTVWFKAYVTIGNKHQLSALSGAMYVELLNEKDSIIYQYKLPVLSGMSKGDFVLSDGLEKGSYRVRAYTQWMRNFEEDYFFDRTIKVGTYKPQPVNTHISYNYGPDLITAKIGFYNPANMPLINKEVNFVVESVKGNTFKGRGKTNAKGELEISFKSADFTGVTSIITTTLKTDDKKESVNTFPIKRTYQKTDLQFFPESGSLVEGVASRVAFKCIDQDGKGLNISGTILDNENTEVAALSTTHAGMGIFRLVPEKGKSYSAKVNYPDGTTSVVKLPAASASGMVLAVYNNVNPDSILVRVSAGTQVTNASRKVSLIAHAGGEVFYSSEVTINQPMVSVWIAKKDFPTGVLNFTLFADEQPLNERIVFIQNNDNLNLKLSSAKMQYGSKEKVKLAIQALNNSGAATVGNFSVAVINESEVPVNEQDEHSIFTSLLLNAELKGYIEKPSYYFTDINNQTKTALDLVMLTHGYRKFVWKELLSGQTAPPLFKAEKIATHISGTLKSLGKKPVADGKITILSKAAGILMDTTTTADGRFSFPGMLLRDSVKFTVQGRTATKSDKVLLELDITPAVTRSYNPNRADITLNTNDSLQSFLNSNKEGYESLRKKGMLQKNISLSDVAIVAKKPEMKFSANLNGYGNANQVIKGDVFLEACPTLAVCLQGRLAGVIFKEGKPFLTRSQGNADRNNDQPMLLILNGRYISGDDLEYTAVFEQNQISPADIHSIEVLRDNMYTNKYGPNANGGVLIINLKPGGLAFSRDANGVVTYVHQGYYKARDFYAPKYEAQIVPKFTAPRTTIYWNPAVVTGSDGTANVEFYNEGGGNYRVLVEGINADGLLGRQIYRYSVK